MGLLRIVVMGNHLAVFISSVIVTGLVSHFLQRYSHRGTHIVYTEVIAVITVALYMFGMILPLFDFYEGFLMPVNLAFSYLWLTSFIFAAQDWSGDRCVLAPPGRGECGKKHTIEAFTFLAFFFLLCNTIAEALLWGLHRRDFSFFRKSGSHRASVTEA
ncbi:might be a transmembrane protein [Ophiocordyceps camponoti-floridani]|uniref:Might be a transmembrane protein n=1 Tax=Ophiocordyceps camponoti-floridani TaxID=2030778 RepID=A0A8H4VF78_9HYPO|nr:might be a transmembrane protein [Ophiocordyceps camponoti-floridani]